MDNGLQYGKSVKEFDLRGKTAVQVESELGQKGFTKHKDVIRDPATTKPLLDANGRAVPQEIYTHPDGGMVRIKPQGQPHSTIRGQPHGSKSVRHPPEADYRDFSHEAFKVDAQGNAHPKWFKDGKQLHPRGSKEAGAYWDGWAEKVHADLAP